MATVYIIYSDSIDKFYIGSCTNLSKRLRQHNNHKIEGTFAGRTNDLALYSYKLCYRFNSDF